MSHLIFQTLPMLLALFAIWLWVWSLTRGFLYFEPMAYREARRLRDVDEVRRAHIRTLESQLSAMNARCKRLERQLAHKNRQMIFALQKPKDGIHD